MARLNLKTIEDRVASLGGREAYDREFIFELLLAYGKPQSNVTRLRNGTLSVADDPETEVAQKNVVYFKYATKDALAIIDELKTSPTVVRYNTRFVIVTDYKELLAVDTKTGENLMISIREINQHFAFFLPWAGMEKTQYVNEAHADVRAAERMGRLFDELLVANPGLIDGTLGRHSLNVFFTRLLFCFFAEDTEIFTESQFTNAVASNTQLDGSDVADFLFTLFKALDTEDVAEKPGHLTSFPYVNGRLFTMDVEHRVPRFNKASRDLLIALGTLNWSEINPDIFGSMFQAVVNSRERSDLGQHYTSVPNILKTIEPLFLENLRGQLDAAFDSARRLEALLERISAIKVFDPACGSGNFLVIAYKELRKLEHAILQRLADMDQKHQVLFAESRINIENYFGIELEDFAVEVAILSLWIAKHQMNAEFKEKFNLFIPLIPLQESGQIQQGNANRIDWNTLCPNDGGEIYLIGNPPYSGSSMQSAQQKADFSFVFGERAYSKNLNYIALWFVKGADYIEATRAELAFVTTKTVSQGDHVGLMFPMIFAKGLEIGFAYPGFQWDNNARKNADVTVAVIGLRNASRKARYIYDDELQIAASNINGYLADGPNIIAARRSMPLSELPPMVFGSKPTDGGFLVLEPEEKDNLLKEHPGAGKFLKRYVGAADYINDTERYCLWIADAEAYEARQAPPIAARLDQVAKWRLESKAQSTVDFAKRPHRFKQVAYSPTESIIVPSISSGLRKYIPIGYVGPETVISNKGFAVYGAEPWLFALLTSRMHMAWVNAVSGRMRINYMYSNTIVYNNFPLPPLNDSMKSQLAAAAFRVLDVREYHYERTLAELYDADNMPANLQEAHAEIDVLVDSIYSRSRYETDEQRLADLFALYEEMATQEVNKTPAKKIRGTQK